GVIMAWCSGCDGEGGVVVVVAAAWGCCGDVVVRCGDVVDVVG
nr:hypothetical protein [Tanacetum cinerariifolium]